MKLNQKISVIRKLSLQFLKPYYVQAIIFMLMLSVISIVPSMLVEVFAYDIDILVTLVNAYTLIIRGPVMLSIAAYFIGIFRNKDLGARAINVGFNNFYRSLELFFRYYIRVTLASFLLVVPGIVLAIRYCLSFYILADNPDMKAKEILAESTRLMKGNTLKYLKLFLSFAPLYILCLIPRGIYVYSQVGIPSIELTKEILLAYYDAYYSPMATALGLLTLICEVWFMTSKACAYDILAEKLVFTGEQGE